MPAPTPHIGAAPGDFSKTVLMPGDPLRAKFVAETFLTDSRLVNEVRGMLGYTGLYEGVPVSVMASGMGVPSMGIYSHELFNFYGVENIIRIGSAGAISPRLRLRDLVFAMSSCTNSRFGDQFGLPGQIAPTADFSLLEQAVRSARALGLQPVVGPVFCSDTFYDERSTLDWGKMGALAVEMESAALYLNAARAGKRALCICTISDSLVTGEALPAEDRQLTFLDMIRVALNTAVSLQKAL
ncbi:MAG: purine-nucleoside phosphorylase [Oscillospiraceae bacterium]|nr:purine-nucleoside phosphorylase [Oscillospiraceae bacterium]